MAKRQAVEKYIIASIGKIDMDNANRYKKLFKSMSDKKFELFINSLKTQKTNLHVYLPNMIKNISNTDLYNLAEGFGISTFERIQFQDNNTGATYYSNHKYHILKLPVRRVKQYLKHKIALPKGDSHISRLSGQVIKPDRGARITLIETYLLVSRGLEDSILEFIKVRGGDLQAYQEFKNKLLSTGSVYLSELDSGSQPRSVLVADSLLKGIHIDTGLLKKE